MASTPPPATPPVNQTFVIDDSPAKASAITAMSLLFFGITLFLTLLRLLSAHDLNGIRQLLMREDTIGWIVTVSPAFWLGYRTFKSWVNKVRDVVVAQRSPNAVLKSELAAMIAEMTAAGVSPLTRASETTTGPSTRLVKLGDEAPTGGPAIVDVTRPVAEQRETHTETIQPAPTLVEPASPADPRAIAGMTIWDSQTAYPVGADVYDPDITGSFKAKEGQKVGDSLFDQAAFDYHPAPLPSAD